MTRALAEHARLRTILKIVGWSSAIGFVMGYWIGRNDLVSALQGFFTGAIVSGLIASVEYGLLRSRAGETVVHGPFAVHVLAKALLYLIATVFGVLAADALFYSSYLRSGFPNPQFLLAVGISVVFAFTFSFIMSLSALLGPKVLSSFITGRYHAPREESRIFLFVDMAGSTQHAERLGPIRFHLFLRRFMNHVGEAADMTGGEIHKYVGDEAIITWPLAAASGGQPLACLGHLRRRISEEASRYRHEFDAVPDFRAGLHGGKIVAGELGGWKKEIAYLGDAVNTTARIAEACRELGHAVLASQSTVAAMPLPSGATLSPIGPVALRGKTEPIELAAVAFGGP